jgi:hypothetical protein
VSNIGVDVEVCEPRKRTASIAPRVLTEKERCVRCPAAFFCFCFIKLEFVACGLACMYVHTYICPRTPVLVEGDGPHCNGAI